MYIPTIVSIYNIIHIHFPCTLFPPPQQATICEKQLKAEMKEKEQTCKCNLNE